MRNHILFVIVIMFIIASCDYQPNSTSVEISEVSAETTTPEGVALANSKPTRSEQATIPIKKGYGSLYGNIKNAHSIFPDEDLIIFSARFYGDPAGEGFYLLEPYLFPKSTLKPNGDFEILNIEMGFYVLLVGMSPEEAKAVMDGSKKMIIEVKRNQAVDIGQVQISP